MWMQIGILLTLVTGFAIGLLAGRISKRDEYIISTSAEIRRRSLKHCGADSGEASVDAETD